MKGKRKVWGDGLEARKQSQEAKKLVINQSAIDQIEQFKGFTWEPSGVFFPTPEGWEQGYQTIGVDPAYGTSDFTDEELKKMIMGKSADNIKIHDGTADNRTESEKWADDWAKKHQ